MNMCCRQLHLTLQHASHAAGFRLAEQPRPQLAAKQALSASFPPLQFRHKDRTQLTHCCGMAVGL